jgi:hypothetical protein
VKPFLILFVNKKNFFLILRKSKGGNLIVGLNILLNENDLREMPSDLRDNLLKWYFSRSTPSVNSLPPVEALAQAPATVLAVPRRVESGRISFSEFARAGLLSPGDELVCMALKRQQRSGGEQYIEAGKVLPDGGVEYRGRRYETPSKLAIAVVNSNGGNTKALNGYEYLFVRSSKGLISLQELRDHLNNNRA